MYIVHVYTCSCQCRAIHSVFHCNSTKPLQVLVEYIDYGNEEVTDRMKLRIALDTELFSLPPQVSIECTK